ncbi:MAG: hypothetical protein EBR30_05185 [Cytophagia bacterium]|nr:hypothetical protein [Cytophagia bacterium]
MRNLFCILTLLSISVGTTAQQIGFTYQAVALDESKAEGFGRDSKGQILLNQALKVRFTIHAQNVEGEVQYQEVHQTTTDVFGIFRVVIGTGEKLQGTSLEELRWSDQSYFMQVEIDLGKGYINMGAEVIVVPPFGLNNTIQLLNLAGTQLSISDGNSIDLSSLLGVARLSEQEVDAYVANNGYLLTEVDGSVTNEIQDLQLTGNQLSITNNPNATSINLSPYLGSNLTEAEVDNMVANNGYITTEVDGSLTNEIQDLNLNNHILSITNNVTATDINLSTYRNIFERNNNVISNQNGDYAIDDFVFGSPQINYTGQAEHANRFYFNKNKGAFRAGRTSTLVDLPDYNGNSWDDQNVGNYSMSFGYNTTASGNGSSSIGIGSIAVGEASFAAGYESIALGNLSVALGYGALAEGETTVALGTLAQAFGIHSTAIGNSVLSVGDRSMTFGITNRANAYGETVFGINGLQASALSTTSFNSADRLFSIGNGVDDQNASNALVMLKNGNTRLHGELTIDADNIQGTGEEYTLPGQDGAANQVMATDGNGNVNWITPAILTESDIDTFVSNNGYLTTEQDGSPTNEIQNLRLTNNILSITNNAAATPISLAPYLDAAFSTANNITTNAPGNYASDSFIFGSPNLDYHFGTSSYARAMSFNKSKGSFRAGHVLNNGNGADVGYYSVAFGRQNMASGESSAAFGNLSRAIGLNSFASGSLASTASGESSAAFGYSVQANGNYSFASGFITRANSLGEVAFGIANTDVPGNSSSQVATDRLFSIGNGINAITRSDALVMLKNGNTRLHGQLTIDADNINGTGEEYTLPGQDGAANQILVTNGNGAVTWQDAEEPILDRTANIISNENGDYTTDNFVIGSPNLNDDGNSTHDTRLLFEKSTGAFRVGTVTDTRWDAAERGTNSVAMGLGNIARGNSSLSLGQNNLAHSASSVAIGTNNQAEGYNSVAIGRNVATTGVHAMALSLYSASRSYGETTMGIYAADYVPNSTTNFNGNDRLFTIGNGLDAVSRSNALVIFKNGDATLLGTLTDASDIRLKRNVKPLQNSLLSLNHLQGVNYQWNGRKPQDTLALQTGLIAQEVEKIFPELVKTDEDGFKSVNYIGLVPHLIEAIKELQVKHERLINETQLQKEESKKKIESLEARLQRVENLVQQNNNRSISNE